MNWRELAAMTPEERHDWWQNDCPHWKYSSDGDYRIPCCDDCFYERLAILRDADRRAAKIEVLKKAASREGIPLIPGDFSGTECWRACMDWIDEQIAELEAES